MKKSGFLIPASLLLMTYASVLDAQTPSPTPAQAGNQSPFREDRRDADIVQINTTLVSFPVSVMDKNGRYIPHLRQEDFRIYEDGVEQQIAHFSVVEKPFTIALLLDASGSTRLRFKDIQAAAIAFIDQLRPDDRVMVISFGDRVEVLTEATGNREVLRNAILQAASGNGTHVYDAVDFVINQRLNRIPGRKAAILFSDGVDNVSRRATYASNLHDAEEAEALIYPVQYDTFAEETTVVAVPGILAGRSPTGIVTRRTIVYPPGFGPKNYERAGAYLRELARKTGARYYHADDLRTLTEAFSSIAEELRGQYSLGYYPKMLGQAGQRRQLRVKVNRRDVITRARRSYIYGSSGQGFIERPQS
ncbi:MAG: Ca-activated chloride channel [Blastocatellia bacterium]|jgi:VWFA-related protein|nr:Ca-activated chloride channel [Blastocatellia bacterium]